MSSINSLELEAVSENVPASVLEGSSLEASLKKWLELRHILGRSYSTLGGEIDLVAGLVATSTDELSELFHNLVGNAQSQSQSMEREETAFAKQWALKGPPVQRGSPSESRQ